MYPSTRYFPKSQLEQDTVLWWCVTFIYIYVLKGVTVISRTFEKSVDRVNCYQSMDRPVSTSYKQKFIKRPALAKLLAPHRLSTHTQRLGGSVSFHINQPAAPCNRPPSHVILFLIRTNQRRSLYILVPQASLTIFLKLEALILFPVSFFVSVFSCFLRHPTVFHFLAFISLQYSFLVRVLFGGFWVWAANNSPTLQLSFSQSVEISIV